MRPKDFQKLLDRDGSCLHCGETEALAPNHRINRGMGGSKKLDHPANFVLLCSEMNNLIESNWFHQELAKQYGWKLERWQDPREVPIFNSKTWQWELLDDNWGKITVLQQTK